jgi:hypothetical protein
MRVAAVFDFGTSIHTSRHLLSLQLVPQTQTSTTAEKAYRAKVSPVADDRAVAKDVKSPLLAPATSNSKRKAINMGTQCWLPCCGLQMRLATMTGTSILPDGWLPVLPPGWQQHCRRRHWHPCC